MALEERQTKGGDELMLLILLSAGLYTAGYFFTFFRIAGQLAWHLAANKDKSETYSYWQSKYGITTVAAPNGEQWAGAITTAFIFFTHLATESAGYNRTGQQQQQGCFKAVVVLHAE
jgi:hypothetical protein